MNGLLLKILYLVLILAVIWLVVWCIQTWISPIPQLLTLLKRAGEQIAFARNKIGELETELNIATAERDQYKARCSELLAELEPKHGSAGKFHAEQEEPQSAADRARDV